MEDRPATSRPERENGCMHEAPRQPPSSARRVRELNRRLRAAFIAGAAEHSRREVGRGLSEDELQRVLRRYPGDLSEQRHP